MESISVGPFSRSDAAVALPACGTSYELEAELEAVKFAVKVLSGELSAPLFGGPGGVVICGVG